MIILLIIISKLLIPEDAQRSVPHPLTPALRATRGPRRQRLTDSRCSRQELSQGPYAPWLSLSALQKPTAIREGQKSQGPSPTVDTVGAPRPTPLSTPA